MHKENYVFYHGMLLEYLLYQDLFSLLFKLCEKKELKNFFMLRNPLDAKNYKDLNDLSKHECKGGALSEFKGLGEFLLSVVPSLFSYTYSLEEVCSAFFYFLNSYNIRSPGIHQSLMRYKRIFDYFDTKKELFGKYENMLQEMLEILQEKEIDRTGLLLQIFIPKKSESFSINDIAYPVVFSGYKNAMELDINKYKKASEYLDFLPVHYAFNYLPPAARDQIQMRPYLKPGIFLNPSNPGELKIFRYYNKTKSIEKYEKLFKDFAEKLANDIKESFQKKPEIKNDEKIIEKESEAEQEKEEEPDEEEGYCIVS